MFIDNLRIDQFGQLRDAYANGLHRLTVLGCSNDSARASARDFIRWMLFGKEITGFANSRVGFSTDPSYRGHAPSARGSMAVTRGGRRRQIQRAGDAAYGRLTVDGRYDDSAHEFRSLVGRVTPREFDAIFAPDFTRDIHPNEILQSINLSDIDLTGHRIPNERLHQLQQRHAQLRSELERLPYRETLQQLNERRTFLLRRIEELNHQEQLRRRELDQQYNEVCSRIAEISSEVERLRTEYQLRDDEANRRRAELEEAWRVAIEAKETYLRERREELSELEHRTDRWRSMLSEVRSRLADVRELRRRLPTNGTHDESQCLVSGLADKLDRLRRDLGNWTDYQHTGYAHIQNTGNYARPVIEDLRREVSQLCQTLQSRRGNNKERWLEHESDYLQHCESLMANWLTKLEEQLGMVRSEVAQIESTGLTLVDGAYQLPNVEGRYSHVSLPPYPDTFERTGYRTTAYDATPSYSDHYTQTFDTDGYYSGSHSTPMYTSPLHTDALYTDSFYTNSRTATNRYVAGYIDWDGNYVRNAVPTSGHYGYYYPRYSTHVHPVQADSSIRHETPIHQGFVQAVPHSCDGYDVIHPDADPLLRELIDLRNRAQSEFEARQRELESLESQREAIEERRRQILDHEIQAVRRELSELESRFRDAEARERLEREIAQVVDQMSRERDDYRPSPVLEQASRILGRLTNGRYTRVRIGGDRHVVIDDAHGIAANLGGTNLVAPNAQFGGRELRADAYLALCLAVVAEYRRKGNDLPIVVSEPFVMANSGHDRTRAAVLRDFAGTGHQVIIATSRPSHTHELFRGFDHVYVDLQPRPVVRPIAPPLPRVPEPPVVPPPEPPAVVEPTPEYEDQVRFKRRASSSNESNHTVESRRTTRESSRAKAHFRRTDAPETARPARFSAHRSATNEPNPSADTNYELESQVLETTSSSKIEHERPSTLFSEEQHSLSLTSPIETTEVIEADVADWLRSNGVETVREFLELMSSDLIQGMTDGGFTAYPVRRWQDELALRCWVVGLAATDASMLVSCGIVDAEQLAEMDTDELYDFLVRSLKTQSGAKYDARRLESLRDRVHFWVRAARRSRTDWVRFRTRNYGKRSWSRTSSRQRTDRPSATRSSSRTGSRTTRTRSNGNGTSDRSPKESRRTSRSSRSSRETSSKSPLSTTATATATRTETSTDESLRFYLDSSDPLVDAPSIGARTAEHFHKIGTMTVGDFIKLKPESAAAKIDNRRISAKTIRQWQMQAILACRIPQIRGHDAQILVACDVTDPTMLARMDPDELWARVKPFSKTSEGKRIIRSGKAPTLAEVRDWVTWAKASRTMRAA